MSDIELVIKIPEIQKKMVDAIMELPPQVENDLISAIRHGTPLPKSHGRILIVSEDIIKKQQKTLSWSCQNWIDEVGLSNATMAIIEADKESEE